MSYHQRRTELSILMQLRVLGFGRNPLRRRVDRIESAVLFAALAVALLMIPAAAALGSTVSERAERTATQRRSELRSVQARTLESTADVVPSSPGLTTTKVRVMWLDTLGTAREGREDVLIGTKAGTELTVWLDPTGAITSAPQSSADSAALGVVAGVTIPMLAWPLLFGLVRFARRPLDRRRAQEWAREWEQVSPRWTNPQH